VGFVVDKVTLGAFPPSISVSLCQFSCHRLLHIHHHLSSGAVTVGQLVADVPSGLSLTPHQETKKKKKKKKRTSRTLRKEIPSSLAMSRELLHGTYCKAAVMSSSLAGVRTVRGLPALTSAVGVTLPSHGDGAAVVETH
jgi:hypothetical protein